MDPTFDQPGPHDYLTKTAGPALAAAALGKIDVVLVSHDEHPDNFDQEGRQVALAAPLVLTHPGAARRLGPPALGLKPFESFELPGEGDVKALTVQAVPAVHGPADGQRDATGHINCEVTGFVLSGPGVPTVYLSGDNASIGAVRTVAERVGTVDVAVLFAGAARVQTKERDDLPVVTETSRAPASLTSPGARAVALGRSWWCPFTIAAAAPVAHKPNFLRPSVFPSSFHARQRGIGAGAGWGYGHFARLSRFPTRAPGRWCGLLCQD